MHKVICKEIESAVNARHPTDVEIAHYGNRERNDIKLVVSFFDQLFNSVSDDRKPHNRIDPHRVVLLNDTVCRQRIEDRKDYYVYLIEALVVFCCLVNVESESEGTETCFEQEYGKQGLKDHTLREESNYIRERACKIVCIHSHKLSAKPSEESIKQTSLTINQISKSLIKIDILSI